MIRNLLYPKNGKYSTFSILFQMFLFGSLGLLSIIALFQFIDYVS
jgi:hypothetical protein